MSLKTVMIAGATRGIGLELATQYTRAGWRVIATARANSNTDKLAALGVHKIVIYDALDDSTLASTVAQLDGVAIDLLINNLGIFAVDTLETVTAEDIRNTYNVNAVGPFMLTRSLLTNLKRAAAANAFAIIANVSSMGGSIELAGLPLPIAGAVYAYRASKAALNMFTSVMAADLKTSNICAVTMHPGVVRTDMSSDLEFDGVEFLTAEASATGLKRVLDVVTMETTGKFLSFDGSPIPW